MRFAPIAIVGRACVLPGALSPEALWDAVATGRDLLRPVPEGRWGLPRALAMRSPDDADADRAWSDIGGYVEGFEAVWDPRGFAIGARELDGVDALVAWTLHCARAARGECAHDGRRTGAVFGNLGFPSASMAAFARHVWAGGVPAGPGRAGFDPADPRHRFMGAGTVSLLRRALALDAGCHALDAACASSLYAIKLACDRLHDGDADLMLAGAVQGADDLFLHVGFCALGALSRQGRSRPFHAGADGLVPAEGAAFVALKRLADAERDGDTIHGVIRGIGLSNDGRGRGLLAPTAEGQQRALRAAWDAAGLDPRRVGLLECHATGTPVGDATELASSAAVFAGAEGLPIGSLKSNLGHLITAAGAAGLIKVLEAMRAGERPPTRPVDEPTPALDGTPFRLLTAREPWPSDGPRIAAVSAFGFGGNNAHLVVSEAEPPRRGAAVAVPAGAPADAARAAGTSRIADVPVAIVGLGALVATAVGRDAFADALLAGRGLRDPRGEGRMGSFALSLDGLRFPPRDLERTLAQQLAMLQAGREALAQVGPLPRERSGVFIGMEPDPEVARYGARWRFAAEHPAHGDAAGLAAARDGIVAALDAAAVVGTMPNIPANRIGSQFDLAGPGFSVMAGAASGLVALRLAARALASGELDAALVGAVDLGCEPVHRAASAAPPGDAAIALVLKRLDDARRDGDDVLAVLDGATPAADGRDGAPCFGRGGLDLAERFGEPFAASGLLHVAAAALCLDAGRVPGGAPAPAAIDVDAGAEEHGAVARLRLRSAGDRGASAAARLRVFAGADRAAVLAALRAGREGGDGPARLVLVADDDGFAAVRDRAVAHLERGAPAGAGVHYRDAPIGGEVAFAFAGAGAAYHGMGRELLQRFPQLRERLRARSSRLADALAWAHADLASTPSAIEQLWGASALSQMHLELTQGLLGLRADAWLGYSSGETNALVGAGVWRDPDALMADMEASGLMTRELGGEFAAIARAWGRPVRWASWTVLAPLAEVRAAVAAVERVYVAIVNGDADCLVAGDAAGCAEVVRRLGESRCLPLVYPLAVHVPEVATVAGAWRALHTRPTRAPSGRVYANAWGRAYVPDPATCARAILEQADRELDVRPAVLAAWNDGVRVFVEHGPRGGYGRAIRQALGDREALVVSLDRAGQGVAATLDAIAALVAAGVPVDTTVLDAAAAAPAGKARRRPAPAPGRTRQVAAHPPPVVWPAARVAAAALPAIPAPAPTAVAAAAPQVMAPAPALPSALRDPPAAPVPSVPHAPGVATPVATIPHAMPDPPDAGMPALIAGQLDHVAQAHAAYVAHQASAHARFSALAGASQRVLVAAARRAPRIDARARAAAAAPPPAAVASPPVASPPVASPPTASPPTAAAPCDVARPPVAIAVPEAEATAPGRRHAPRGPRFDRADLEVHADGRISTIFGPAFAGQDGFERQVRMPKPPLLLADRVTGLDAEPMGMGRGRIWTETDVVDGHDFLHAGRWPAGVLIESGQADLMLVSWLGVDALNRGERVYRLLGCELTYHGDLPRAGDTLAFEISLDGHAAQGDVRLMFFHYECMNGERLQLSVRKGQAGFFSDADLAGSAGCLWEPETQAIVDSPRLDPPAVDRVPAALDRAQLEALAAGDGFACFGEGFEPLRTHTRTPGIAGGRMQLLDRVTRIEPAGGPWGRGWLRAELDITPDHWFFDGHFRNDPCMPGTLMFEGCLQAMAVYLAALGHTLPRDGWCFQPVPELPYQLQCRGQVTPASKRLVTEVFVEEVIAGPVPTLFADLLCTVDGLKAFHARRVALQLVPDWPLATRTDLLAEAARDTRPVAVVDGFRFDQASLLACAFGQPSHAFGPMYTRFDGPVRVARLPSPPYLFMSRIVDVQGPIGEMKAGARVRVEWDIPPDAWFFADNGARTMPFAVLLEAALQPCGWLSSYVGSALTEEGELGFRNLDGDGELLDELLADAGTLATEVELTDVSATGGMIIETFAVRCFLGAREVYRLKTVFGFFPPAALAAQAGLRTSDDQHALLQRASNVAIDLADPRAAHSAPGRPRLADGKLLMLDRIEGLWPASGGTGRGQLRAVKDIDAGEWFFKAHFFQDPVQPGSLGIEAMLQALQFWMLHAGLDRGLPGARFEPIALQRPHRWKYRGQVLPKHRQVHTTLDVIETGTDHRGVYALANASLWADGQRIYEIEGLGMRMVAGARR